MVENASKILFLVFLSDTSRYQDEMLFGNQK